MDGVQSIESLAAGDAPHHSFRTLGPTLLISMGYLDLGKWVVALEAGSRFGYDLVLLVLLFNLSAILLQYLSSCIGMVTGKNLAEICHQEYSKTICVVLGLEAGLSLLTSKIAMLSDVAFEVTFGILSFAKSVFKTEILFGDSIWTNNLRGNTGSPVVLPYAVIVLCSCGSIASALILAVTPLKSACNGAERRSPSVHSQNGTSDTTHQREATSRGNCVHKEVQMSYIDAVPMSSFKEHSMTENLRVKGSCKKVLEVEEYGCTGDTEVWHDLIFGKSAECDTPLTSLVHHRFLTK
ncbi:hypothetical protein EJB05_05014 [Eragrostis curvula]|uniref:Uncharacterized protein n=1 Tax=Eragrostis curvula TaxID=38414 RepID=A0A5J9WC86_9POAL|nr:hypothetical protein EJB05_05014 [Eragrostis curvula]